MIRLSLVLGIACTTWCALDRHARAAESVQCDRAALARAESNVLVAQSRRALAWGPGMSSAAVMHATSDLLEAALVELDAARVLCSPSEREMAAAAAANPFRHGTEDPFDADGVDPDTAAFRAVMGVDGDEVTWSTATR